MAEDIRELSTDKRNLGVRGTSILTTEKKNGKIRVPEHFTDGRAIMYVFTIYLTSLLKKSKVLHPLPSPPHLLKRWLVVRSSLTRV